MPEVSTAVWMPRARQVSRSAARNSGCIRGSPPEKVAPPPDSSKKITSRSSVSITCATVVRVPASARAPQGHSSTHVPHVWHRAATVTKRPFSSTMASLGQTVRQVPQRSQRSGWTSTSGSGDWLSGLWHHQQRSGQPLRKTVVRMPGPSCTAKRSTRNTTPVTAAGSGAVGA